MTILVAEGLVLSYRGMKRPVLDGISISVSAGQSLAVMGPSGSGKTTLLSVLAGFLRPDSGSVIGPADQSRATTAWVTQTTNALGRRTALDNVLIGAQAGGFWGDAAVARAEYYLGEVGLADKIRRRARSLSGGELQRLAIARALALGAPLIFADEPTGQLDAETSAVIIELLARCVAEGSALICVTHDAAVAAACDRIAELSLGQIRVH